MENKDNYINVEKIIKNLDLNEDSSDNEVENLNQERKKLYDSKIESLLEEWNLNYILETKDGDIIYDSNDDKNNKIDYLIENESDNNNLYIKSSKTNIDFIELYKDESLKGSKVLDLIESKNNEITTIKNNLKLEKKRYNTLNKFLMSIQNKIINIGKKFEEFDIDE